MTGKQYTEQYPKLSVSYAPDKHDEFMKHHALLGSSRVIGSRTKYNQQECHLKVFDRRNMNNIYEHPILYISDICIWARDINKLNDLCHAYKMYEEILKWRSLAVSLVGRDKTTHSYCVLSDYQVGG